MKVFFSTIFGLIIGYIIGVPKDESHGPNSNDVKKYIKQKYLLYERTHEIFRHH